MTYVVAEPCVKCKYTDFHKAGKGIFSKNCTKLTSQFPP